MVLPSRTSVLIREESKGPKLSEGRGVTRISLSFEAAPVTNLPWAHPDFRLLITGSLLKRLTFFARMASPSLEDPVRLTLRCPQLSTHLSHDKHYNKCLHIHTAALTQAGTLFTPCNQNLEKRLERPPPRKIPKNDRRPIFLGQSTDDTTEWFLDLCHPLPRRFPSILESSTLSPHPPREPTEIRPRKSLC